MNTLFILRERARERERVVVLEGLSYDHRYKLYDGYLFWSRIEDPPTFLPNFKNPCFYDKSGNKQILRCLPYFHIFGVCKTGTTDLYQRLLKHPQIIPNRGILKKETWYWTWRRYGKGSGDPMDFWDHTQWKFIPQNNISWLEPKYTAPNLIRHVLPKIRLIVMLRDPIERLYSHYYHAGYGSNRQSFHRDVMSALQVLHRCRQNFTLRSCLYNQTIMNQLNVPIYASIYHVHMKTWMDVFPSNQIHIIRTEDFSKDLSGHMTELFKFLNISDVSQKLLQNISTTRHAYETQKKKSAGPMLQETWDILKTFFDIENKELVKLLNNTKFNWEDIYLNQRKSVTNKDHMTSHSGHIKEGTTAVTVENASSNHLSTSLPNKTMLSPNNEIHSPESKEPSQHTSGHVHAPAPLR
ncbi:hypothetical protein FSP39_014149 [Pinctada imbricata]|uniref:Sulfotransferase domain-containing protein n=1 Tax=Pinctada imbricata TaxID=66713 RepID=A0AA89BMC5_PINIB|nr:hypothetical protein FSP39_014149 [Pinctada imbricata]